MRLLRQCIPSTAAAACFVHSQDQNQDRDDIRSLEIHALLSHLQLRIDTQHCQQQIYFGVSREHLMRAEHCAHVGDAQGARQFLVERRKALRYQQLELQQMSVLLAVKEQIERAQRNVEMARHLATANMTLDELLAAVSENGVALEDTLDELREKVVQVCEHSALLAEPLEAGGALDVDDDALDEQVKQLMLDAAPRVPVTLLQPYEQQKQSSVVNSKVALKSE